MLDWIPVEAWGALIFALLVYPTGRYIFRYLTERPSQTIGLDPEEWGWRRPKLFWSSVLSILVVLAISAFILFADWRAIVERAEFWPLLSLALGFWVIGSTTKGIWTGNLEPWIRGRVGPYDIDGQPVRFYLSLLWNIVLASILFWMGIRFFS